MRRCVWRKSISLIHRMSELLPLVNVITMTPFNPVLVPIWSQHWESSARIPLLGGICDDWMWIQNGGRPPPPTPALEGGKVWELLRSSSSNDWLRSLCVMLITEDEESEGAYNSGPL